MTQLIKSLNKKLSLDFIGMILSFTCSIHCALLPLFMVVKPMWSDSIFYSEGFENSIIVSSVFIALFSLGVGFKKHRKSLPLIIMGISFLFILFGKLNHDIEAYLIPFAGILLFVAHSRNHKLLHSAE